MAGRAPPSTNVTHEDILARMARGHERFRDIDTKLAVILDRLEPIPGLQTDMAEMKEDVAQTKELVEAWTTVKTLSRFLKWVAGLIAAVVAIGIAAKTGIAQMIGN